MKRTEILTSLLPSLAWLVPIIVCEPISFVLMLLSAITIHECGHAFAFFITRTPAPRLSGTHAGLLLTPKAQLSYKSELIIASMGPAFNLMLAFALIICSKLSDADALHLLIGVNFSCALCNLLPVFELDGGRILFSLCALFFSLEAAEKIKKITTFFVLSLLLFFSLWLILILDIGYRILIYAIIIAIAASKNKR